MEEVFKKKNLRVTQFRKQVLELFKSSPHALDLTTVEKGLGEHDRVTLYRTLKTFIDSGIIHEVASSQGKKMALCAIDCEHVEHNHVHEHVHFECVECKEVFCIETSKVPSINLKGFQVDTLELNARGVCASCK